MPGLRILSLATLTVLFLGVSLPAQEEAVEEPYLPGLIAKYSDGSSRSFRRLDEAIAFHWEAGAPDARLAAEKFEVQWRGKLFAQGAGDYRLAVHAVGEVEVKLAGKTVIPRQQAQGWVFSEPITLEFDRHELEVSFRKTASPAHVSLFWSGPQFGLEPIPPRHLLHDGKEAVQNLYKRGELLAAALRCAACHREKLDPQPLPAPSLLHLGGNINVDWIQEWLIHKGQEEYTIRRRMPAYGLSEDDAAAITAYLFSNQPAKERPKKEAAPAPPPTKPKPSDKPAGVPAPTGPTVDDGAMLFLTRGCLACHQVNGLGDSGLFGGGDFSKIAAKRPPGFFSDWLADPAKLNPDHRMPVFDLSPWDRTALDRYLSWLGETAKPTPQIPAQPDQIANGRKLVATHRCASCHTLRQDAELPPAASVKPLSVTSDWRKSCAATSDVSRAHLGYSMNKEDQKALQEFYSAKLADNSGGRKPSGRLSLIQNNCLACHGREGLESLSPNLPTRYTRKVLEVVEFKPHLEPSVPAMTPPSLNSIGDKFPEEALTSAIRRQGPPLRDYLLIRMPRFPLPDDELKRLVNYLVQTDRIPPLPDAITTKPSSAEEAAFALAGSRLVSTDGFGCTSCHQVGKVIPDKAPLNARGPSLSSLDKRIRKEWYDRFLHNPARIVPRMEMPSVQIPVKGVFDSKLDPQLAALWHVLSTPGFEPPEPNPVRVLRLSGDLEKKESPVVVTDLVKMGDKTFVRPFLVGLPNRHNILFDLETNRLAGWWIGDAARQRTKGKSWLWESGGDSLLPVRDDDEFSLELAGNLIPLKAHDGTGVRLKAWGVDGKMSFFLATSDAVPLPKPHSPFALTVMSSFKPLWKKGRGFERAIKLEGMPPDLHVVMAPLTAGKAREFRIEEGGKLLSLSGPKGLRIRVIEPETATFQSNGTLRLPTIPADFAFEQAGAKTFILLEYTTGLGEDIFPVERLSAEGPEDLPVEIGTGMVARRLGLPSNVMPTGLTWRSDNKLLCCTLRGEVLMIDDNSAGHDSQEVIADGLPAPYGLEASDDRASPSVVVAAKTGLIRITYGNAPSVHRAAVLTANWGYTADYHDWSVGLVRGKQGEYYLGLPCQQDERSKGAAELRGTVIAVSREKSDLTESAKYPVSPISSGHRFPMGLAVNKDGDLFVTDNQGNYNPFNELNHVRKGAFFGFVNAIDKKNKDYKVPPLTEPAINIPHPWTRSVNGICFLYTPEKLKKETGKDAFGPLEGQLVGCEYDTRRLIRMSLQKIGETYQGCAYPLSREPSSPEKGFLGPIVCAVSPRGELYVGSIRESGWGAGNNVGEIVKIKFEPEKMPCGIAEVKAVKNGFAIDFLKEVDAKKAADLANYSISSYRRISTPAYGGPDVDRRTEKVDSVELSADHRRVTVKLPELRTGGFVYEIQLKNLAPADAEFFPAEAYFTLHGVP